MPRGQDQAIRAEANFRARLAELGAQLLEPEWHGALVKHHVRCSAGHDCYPKPNGVQQGRGICITCAGHDPIAAEAAFRARLAELGATPLYEKWLGARHPHHVRCRAGHDCNPRPDGVRSGQGICVVCAGKSPDVAEAVFRSRLAELGATLLEPTWLGNKTPHRARCANGHGCRPRPNDIQQGRGICRVCAGSDPVTAEAAFRLRLAELGAEVLFEDYAGSMTPHHVKCPVGHDWYPRPRSVARGEGCRACAGKDPAAADAAFRARLVELGATPLYEEWLGKDEPHQARCAAGHDCWPRPSGLRDGGGCCITCTGKSHTVFYVLEHPGKFLVKFGISNLDGRLRLANHRRDGFTVVHLLVTDLADGTARATEDAAKAALALAGEKPVRGKEYFDIACLALVLDVADSWLGAKAASSLAPAEWIQAALFAA